MTSDDRARFDAALRQARVAAYAPGEYVEQESFMRSGEILDLARRAGVGPGVSVLDLCCGVAGPGRHIARELGCRYLGVDANAGAVAIARTRAADLPCRFEVAHVPPIPAGPFDVVLLLETMLAFSDKRALLDAIAGRLAQGGRLAFTLEEGAPLTRAERAGMPTADTVWLTPLDEMRMLLHGAGFTTLHEQEFSGSHRSMAQALADAFQTHRSQIAAQIGAQPVDDLIAAHRLWIDWLGSGRVRKFAFVAECTAPD